MALTVPTLSMDQINKLTGSIYVVNSSDNGRRQPKGNIVFTVTGQDGTTLTVVVPKTFVPIDLTTWCRAEDIKNSTEFRALIRKSQLHVIDAKYAEQFLSQPASVAEVERLSKTRSGIISDNTVPKNITLGMTSSDTVEEEPVRSPLIKGRINPAFELLVNKFNAGVEEKLLIAELRTLDLTQEDLVWATNNIKDTSSDFFAALSDGDAPEKDATFRS